MSGPSGGPDPAETRRPRRIRSSPAITTRAWSWGPNAALLVTHDRPALRVHADPETRDALWYRGRDSGMNGPLRGGAPVVTLDQHGRGTDPNS